MIETLHEKEDLATAEVLFRWRGMTIFLARTLSGGEGKCLSVTVANASVAGHFTGGTTATWIISKAGEGHSDAGASITSAGPVPGATEKDIRG